MFDLDAAVRVVRAMPTNERGEEDALRYLREAGMTMIGSVRVLVRARGYSLAEVKPLVHYSETWADQRAANEEFHEHLYRAVQADADKENE